VIGTKRTPDVLGHRGDCLGRVGLAEDLWDKESVLNQHGANDHTGSVHVHSDEIGVALIVAVADASIFSTVADILELLAVELGFEFW
jgi:hypothetical protein